ncbi:hypothetical protein [Gemmata sp. SH-PL17]|uniref:hypothetical protein n=1 Tax=Gemmata sp. SH-PL17 TaxID=1630693 RepID=UPI00069828AB|nr:hypothetical protein [Gemmata sp. SH-PL17]
MRFFAFSCCRFAWPAVTDERSRRVIEIAELHAVNLATLTQFNDAISDAYAARCEAQMARENLFAASAPHIDHVRATSISAVIATHVAWSAAANGFYNGMLAQTRDALAFRMKLDAGGTQILAGEMCHTLRDIFGNPFRPVRFSPEWRTNTALALAERMYAARDFGTLPVLADALQDAGCDNEMILNHCRDPLALHVRGCWVVDLVLGKE